MDIKACGMMPYGTIFKRSSRPGFMFSINSNGELEVEGDVGMTLYDAIADDYEECKEKTFDMIASAHPELTHDEKSIVETYWNRALDLVTKELEEEMRLIAECHQRMKRKIAERQTTGKE